MVNNATRFKEKFGVVRVPDQQGQIVLKLANDPLVAQEVWDHPDLVFQSVADVSSLTDATVDRSGLSQEIQDLLLQHYGVES